MTGDGPPTWLMTRKATPATIIGCIYALLAAAAWSRTLSGGLELLDLALGVISTALLVWAFASASVLRRNPAWHER